MDVVEVHQLAPGCDRCAATLVLIPARTCPGELGWGPRTLTWHEHTGWSAELRCGAPTRTERRYLHTALDAAPVLRSWRGWARRVHHAEPTNESLGT